MKWLLALALVGCSSPASNGPVIVDLRGQAEGDVTTMFDAPRDVIITGGDGHIVEAWANGRIVDPGNTVDPSGHWLPPRLASGDVELAVSGSGTVTFTAWARGDALPVVSRDRSLAWFDGTLDEVTSFAKVMAAISDNGGVSLDKWFRAFAAGPGAGRATFAQFLDEIVAAQGPNPAAWNLATLPFKVTGVHNRIDLANAEHCGELRVSIASTHPTFSPVHLIFLFRQPPGEADVTPDGGVHCRGTARAWARLTALDATAFRAAAQKIIDTGITRERFLLAESVELSLSPWQWRQWTPDGSGGFSNPPLFQTIDVTRVNPPGALRDAFLADVAANATAIADRRWLVPAMYRSAVAEVQPNSKAPLVDAANLSRPLSLIGCPRCHTDEADFLQTGIDRKPSPFYDKELDARAKRLDSLGRGELPPPPPFGPLGE